MNASSSADDRDEKELERGWKIWHHDHEQQRASQHGFLAITGMHWLSDVPERFSDVPGAWTANAEGVSVDLSEGESLIVDDQRVTGRFNFGPVDEIGRRASFGDAIVEIAKRDDLIMIRPRHPDNPARLQYAGTPTYPPRTQWVARGRLVRYDEPRPVSVGATVEGMTHVYTSPGEIQFELSGQPLRLVAFNGDQPDELFIVFSDETSGNSSYAACRFLDAVVDEHDGVTMDFNRARNPPCAYSDFATCPLPPTGNDLRIRIEAGEKRPIDSH